MAFTGNGNRPLTLPPRYRPLIPLPCQNRKGTTRSLSFQDWIARYYPPPPFVSPPPFDVVQLYQGNSLERVGKLRNVSRLLIYLSLSLFSPPVTIKSKVFDPSIRKIKKRKDTSLRGTRVLLSMAIFVVRFYRQAIVARSIARLESSGMLSKWGWGGYS